MDFINEDKDDKKEKISSGVSESRKYVYKIWKRGKDDIHILNEILDYIEKEYEKETNLYTQTIFEYKKSFKDEDEEGVGRKASRHTVSEEQTSARWEHIYWLLSLDREPWRRNMFCNKPHSSAMR